mmetsp:Transcript_20373/g.59504  ORF Transcript_20373/g.59504 Transcript_20373/m.59504 type:complete len:209 (-) Transcript_20373:503-1129(-)
MWPSPEGTGAVVTFFCSCVEARIAVRPPPFLGCFGAEEASMPDTWAVQLREARATIHRDSSNLTLDSRASAPVLPPCCVPSTASPSSRHSPSVKEYFSVTKRHPMGSTDIFFCPPTAALFAPSEDLCHASWPPRTSWAVRKTLPLAVLPPGPEMLGTAIHFRSRGGGGAVGSVLTATCRGWLAPSRTRRWNVLQGVRLDTMQPFCQPR